jgi:hypothetical protein
MRLTSSTKMWAWMAAGVVGGLVLAVAFLLGSGETDHRTRGQSAGVIPGPALPGEVCEGQPSSLDAVEGMMPFPLAFPDAAIANDAALKAVWKCNTTQAALEYDSGVVVYESVNTLGDPEAVWKRMADEYPEFSVGVVNGVPASLADPTIGIGTIGGVDMVVNGVRVTVSGNGKIALSDLVDVAESISFASSSTPSPSVSTGT